LEFRRVLFRSGSRGALASSGEAVPAAWGVPKRLQWRRQSGIAPSTTFSWLQLASLSKGGSTALMSSAAMCGNRTGAHVNVLVLADLTGGRYPPASAREARSLGRRYGARPEDSTPFFAGPFPVPSSPASGATKGRSFCSPEFGARCWTGALGRARSSKLPTFMFIYATRLLALQRQYAAWSGLSLLAQSLV